MLKVISVSIVVSAFIGLFPNSSFARSHEGSLIKASFYTSGSRTASGEAFDPDGFTAASRTLPFGARLHVTNPKTGRSVIVRINDRGPFIRGRGLDLARGAAAALGILEQGIATLKIARLN
ncbi:septal ring lytic transglycosylase RlpA family protein [Methylocapsa polymorpha]|uniref:Endolytic peptidoglycan transglycosylase RlpA n=1 Tax=Methylocapsa polymorpha TaxID=3080828 RepID=A0ABZ0HU83_9HYPH|nr:septal ring lytic transglycosylase RlpA family protein [Methylocapsa sp. RX1]